ncbi:MAG: NAD(P)-binding domain-containing protein, partial [Actinomycetota bacterium]
MHDLKFAVLGAGHGGKAVAAHLAIKGFKVNIYNRTFSRIQPIKKMKGIELEGEIKGFGKLDIVTSDIEKAIKDVDIIMVVVP